MNGFERRKERKKEQIINAALELFRDFGFKRINIADIAERANVSQVTIYNYFGSKHDLTCEAVRRFLDNLIETYEKIIHSGKPYPERLKAIILDKSNTIVQFQGELIKTVYQELPELSAYIDARSDYVFHKMMPDFLDEGRKLGFIRRGASDEAVISYFGLLLQGLYSENEYSRNLHGNPDLLRQVYSLMVYGFIDESSISGESP